MALCLITISGTSGSLELIYTVSGDVNHTYIGTPGDIGIDDTATSVQAITHTGDLTASSSCSTVTAISPVCNDFIWEKVSDIYKAKGILFSGTELLFLDEVSITNNVRDISNAINSLNDYRIKAVGYKQEATINNQTGELVNYQNNIKIKVFSNETNIFLILRSDDDTSTLLVPLTSSTCTMTGYEEVPICSYETPSV